MSGRWLSLHRWLRLVLVIVGARQHGHDGYFSEKHKKLCVWFRRAVRGSRTARGWKVNGVERWPKEIRQ